MNKKYILFDLDGTLTDPYTGITNSVLYALKKFKINENNPEKLRKFIGPPLVESFMDYYGLSKEDALIAVGYYREYFKPKGIYENKVYDGVKDMLDELCICGKKLYVASSKPEPFVIEILRYFGLYSYFYGIYGSTLDETRTKKDEVIAYALERSGIKKCEAVMVGDRQHDIYGAKKNGLMSIGVLYGYGDRNEHLNANADIIVSTVEELKIILKGDK